MNLSNEVVFVCLSQSGFVNLPNKQRKGTFPQECGETGAYSDCQEDFFTDNHHYD